MSLDPHGQPFSLYEAIKRDGWQAGQAITCVAMEDGELTALNNRSLSAIRKLVLEDPSCFLQKPVTIRVVPHQETSSKLQQYLSYVQAQRLRTSGESPLLSTTMVRNTLNAASDSFLEFTTPSPLIHPLTASAVSSQQRSPLMPNIALTRESPSTWTTYGDLVRLRIGDAVTTPYGFVHSPRESTVLARSLANSRTYEDDVQVDET